MAANRNYYTVSHPFNARFSKYGSFEYLSKFLYVSATLSQLGLASMAKERHAKRTVFCWKISMYVYVLLKI